MYADIFFIDIFEKCRQFLTLINFYKLVEKSSFYHLNMKYYLRSSSTELQTNQISSTVSQKEFLSIRNKNKNQPKKSKKSRKVSKKQSKQIKDKLSKSKNKLNLQKKPQSPIIHEKIMRFPLKYKKSTLRVYCYKESDLGIPRRFSRRFIQHKKDDDQQSWDSLIESEVQRCKNALFESVRKYSEALSHKTIENPAKQQYYDDENHSAVKKEEKCRKKKKISKRKRNN